MPDIVGRMRSPRLASAPAAPAVGEMYYDTPSNQLLYWNGSQWVSGGSGGSGGGGVIGSGVATTAARMYRNAALTASVGSNAKIPLDSISFDTSGLASTSLGRINISVSGYYAVEAALGLGGAAPMSLAIYKNGTTIVSTSLGVAGSASNWPTGTLADVIQCNAGDYLELYGQQLSGTAMPWQPGPPYNWLSVALLASVPGAVGPTTPARAYRNAALTSGAGAFKFPVDTITYDPGGNFSLANSRYTCPATGYYQVNAQAALTVAASGSAFLAVYKNGTEVTRGDRVAAYATATYGITVSDTLQCNAGDYLELWYYNNTAAPFEIYSAENYLSVVQVGNLAATPASTACARAYRNAAQSIPATTATKIALDSTNFDTSGMVQIGNGRIVCPVSGYYQVDGAAGLNGAASMTAYIYKNGAVIANGSFAGTPASGWTISEVSDVIQCNAGDYLELWIYSSAALNSVSGPTVNYLSVALLTPLSGTAGPVTAARAYRSTAATSGTANTWNKLPVDTVASGNDPGGNISTVNGRYTCPATGWYQVNGEILFSGNLTGNVSIAVVAGIYKNGAIASTGSESPNSGSNAIAAASVSDLLYCNAGDYLELWYLASGTGWQFALAPNQNYLSVVQVGNSMNFTQAGGDLTGTYPNPTIKKSRITAQPVLDTGVAGQIRAGRQLTAADFTALGLSAPAGLWNLSDLTDASGNGRALTNKGSVPFGAGINGVASTAAVFSGSTAQALYISDTGAGDPFRQAQVSVGCWMRTAKLAVSQAGVTKRAAGQIAYQLSLTTGNVASFGGTPDGSTFNAVSGVSNVCDDRWHFLVGTFDGAYTRIYVDGVLEGTLAMTFTILFYSSAPLNIGGWGADGSTVAGDAHYGRVDEAFVTADVLSPDQIRALYCAKIAHTYPGVPSTFNLSVRRARKGGPYAVSDFPTQPLRLHNFTAGALTDQGSGNVALTNNGAALSVAGADGSSAGAYNFVAASSQSLSSTDAGLPTSGARSYGCWLKSTGTVTLAALAWGSTTATRNIIYLSTGNVYCVNLADSITGPFVGDGQWHHVVAVEDNAAGDGVKRKLYVDGLLVGGSTVFGTVTLGGANFFRVGADVNGTSPFAGQIDGAFVCGVALTQDQVSILYAKASQALAPSPKNAGDHIEFSDSSSVYACFDTLDSQFAVDLAVSG